MFKVRYAIGEDNKRSEERSPYSGEKFEDLYEKHIMNYNRELNLEVKWTHHRYAKLSENEHDSNKFIDYYEPKYSYANKYKLDNDDVNSLYVNDKIKMLGRQCYTENIPHEHLANVVVTRDLIGDSDFEFGYVTCDKLTLDLKVTPNYEMFLNEYDELSLVSHLTIYDAFNHKFTVSVPIGTFIVADIDKTDLKYSLICYDYLYWSSVGPNIIRYDDPNTSEDDGNILNYKKYGSKKLHNILLSKYDKNFNTLDNVNKTGIRSLFGSLRDAKDAVPQLLANNIPNVDVEYLEDELQVRNFWGFIAGLTGGYIRADKTGIATNSTSSTTRYKPDRESSFIFYQDTTKSYSASQFGEFIKKNYDMKITRLECVSVASTPITNAGANEDKFSIDEITYTSNENGIDVYSFSNPLMTQAELDVILSQYNVFNNHKGFAYTPISCKIIGDPRLDIGDIITLNNRERPNKESLDTVIKSYKLPIMLQTINFKSGKSCIMTAESISDKYRKREAYTGLSVQEQLKDIVNKLTSVEGQVYSENDSGVSEEDLPLVTRVEKLEQMVGDEESGDSGSNTSLYRRVRNIENEVTTMEINIDEMVDNIDGNTSRISSLEREINGYDEQDGWWGEIVHVDGLKDKVVDHSTRIDSVEDGLLDKSNIGHTHKMSDIEGLEIPEIPDNTDLYERMNVIEQTLPNKSDIGHTHTVSEITDLQLPDNSELENRITLLEEKIELLEQPEQPNEPDVDPGSGKKFILPSQCEGIIEKTSLDTDFILDDDFPIESPLYLKVIKASDTIILIEVTYLNEESNVTTDKYTLIDGIYTLL